MKIIILGGAKLRLLFLSDIHGSISCLETGLSKFEEEKADMIVFLGDLLYHGPRNPIPEGYDPQKVSQLLNANKDKLMSVRGNCDSEVDQMVLEFPILGDYHIILMNKRRIFVTHGHLFNENNMPPLSSGDVLVHGHTHVPVAKKVGEQYLLNPGSTTLPKENYKPSYGILTEEGFEVKDMEGNILKSIRFE